MSEGVRHSQWKWFLALYSHSPSSPLAFFQKSCMMVL